ncbi:astacin [Dictyocaulus viviparus]|uniref:Zinc metalloproteinase n=1 Tax=Dictyocaulus viviparus TaxID=29172 RepID=A0A0D8XHQ5_DICVI|nr:astacin [Dictyocaulus viviparus]
MNNLSNLPLSQKKELFEAYRRSNIELVYTKLNSLRKKWMEKLQKEDIAHPQYRFPTKEIPEKLPSTEIPVVQAITNINRNANISEFFYQSDIILTLAQIEQISENDNPDRVKRQAYRDIYYPHTIWDKTFYYYFSATATDAMKMVFMAAIKYWQEHTCIKFVEDRTAPNRVRVFKGDGCYSYVGRIGGEQDLSLGKGCESVGTAAHELGHALGFFHSQSRVDRDDEISIIVANIQPEFVDQFGKESAATNNNYGMPYDYGSIMHYGASSASRNGRNTMVAKQENYQETMGSDIVAFYDVSMMNEHYNCKVQCSPHSSVSCQNGGYPNPNNCTICNCPSGYGGALCNERPVGCGDILTAGPHFSYIATVIGDGTLKTKIDFDKCNYWIQAPPGKRIQVRLENYEGFTIDGCIYGGVEFKAHADQLRTGYR